MMSLAEHIIEATPERIKREHFPTMESVPLDNSGLTNTMSWLASYLGDVEHLPSIIHLRLVDVITLIYICTDMGGGVTAWANFFGPPATVAGECW